MSESSGSSGTQTEKEVSASKKWLSVKEAEALGYYDFMSYLGVPYYHTGGLTSTRKLADLCRIDRTKKILLRKKSTSKYVGYVLVTGIKE